MNTKPTALEALLHDLDHGQVSLSDYRILAHEFGYMDAFDNVGTQPGNDYWYQKGYQKGIEARIKESRP